MAQVLTSTLKRGIVQLKNVNINYQVKGCGKKVALCLPGSLGTIKSDYGPQLQSLAGNDVTLVVWEPPGYGASRPPNRNFTLDYLNKDAELAGQLMQHLGNDKYSVLGWSDGGTTGMLLAAAFPESVEKLIVWAARAYITEHEIKMYNELLDKSKASPEIWAYFEAAYGVDYFRYLREGIIATLNAIKEEKNGDLCMGKLSDIRCPTLIIHGEKDPIVPVEHPNYLYKNIKGSKLIMMPEGKHNVHLRYADEFNRIVLDFLSECDPHMVPKL